LRRRKPSRYLQVRIYWVRVDSLFRYCFYYYPWVFELDCCAYNEYKSYLYLYLSSDIFCYWLANRMEICRMLQGGN
jgi:hypothetical protein